MTDIVNHPPHYTAGFGPCNVECIDVSQHLGFCPGNAFKYIWRAGNKGGETKLVEDLDKARWYLMRVIDYRLYPPPEGVYAAMGVFGLIPRPDVDNSPGLNKYVRYNLLNGIVYGHWRDVYETLLRILGELRKPKAIDMRDEPIYE